MKTDRPVDDLTIDAYGNWRVIKNSTSYIETEEHIDFEYMMCSFIKYITKPGYNEEFKRVQS